MTLDVTRMSPAAKKARLKQIKRRHRVLSSGERATDAIFGTTAAPTAELGDDGDELALVERIPAAVEEP